MVVVVVEEVVDKRRSRRRCRKGLGWQCDNAGSGWNSDEGRNGCQRVKRLTSIGLWAGQASLGCGRDVHHSTRSISGGEPAF